MISVLILTHNEAVDIAGCLASVGWSDDVHVFDSNSTDATAEIAKLAGATVSTRAFDSFARQRNAALDTVPFRYQWVFVLDADERATVELGEEMAAAVSTVERTVVAFRVRRRDFLWSTWLKHAQISPWYVRLFRLGRVRYTREVNESIEADGDVAELRNVIDHYPFSKGISHWVAKHNMYSSMEAELVASGVATDSASLRQAFFQEDFHLRRASQKALFFKLPFRPVLKWCYMVFWRRALLDGRAGIAYATLQSFYEYMIVLKTREIINQENEATVPLVGGFLKDRKSS